MYTEIFEDENFFLRFSLSSTCKITFSEWRTRAMKEGLNRRIVVTEDLLHQRDPGSLQDEKEHGEITLWTKLLTTRKLYKSKLAMRSL